MEEQLRPKQTVGGSSPSRGTILFTLARTFLWSDARYACLPGSGRRSETLKGANKLLRALRCCGAPKWSVPSVLRRGEKLSIPLCRLTAVGRGSAGPTAVPPTASGRSVASRRHPDRRQRDKPAYPTSSPLTRARAFAGRPSRSRRADPQRRCGVTKVVRSDMRNRRIERLRAPHGAREPVLLARVAHVVDPVVEEQPIGTFVGACLLDHRSGTAWVGEVRFCAS